MRRKQTIWAGAVLVATVLAVGACTDSSGKTSGAALGSSNDAAHGSAGLGLTTRMPAAGPSAAGPYSAKEAPGAKEALGTNALAPTALGQSAQIRTATMTVAVTGADHVSAQADRAIALADQVGGEVDADNRSAGANATANLVLRVPPPALQSTLTALGHLGTEKSRQLSTTDVTEQVADVSSRVASASAEIDRLRDLYARATKVSDVIAVESQLSTREADLESLQAQQRALSRQTSLATITLSLVTATPAPAPPPVKHHQAGGFAGGLRHGWHGFLATARWLAAAVGTLLPFLVVLALLGAAGLAVTRARRRQPGSDRSHPAS